MSDTPLDSMIRTCQQWLHLPDPGALYALLGTVAANRLEGDPVWLLLVGPPGGGKTELLMALNNLDDTHPTATLTEAALLSGTSARDKAKNAKGGLLRTIGDFGIIVAKDFGSVLSMNRDGRALVLAALREVYDGSWTRHVGTDGGRTMTWAGKVGFVGGCTPTIDRHHAVMGAMGERFLFYRLPDADESAQARRALTHAGHEKAMRSQLAEGVAHVLNGNLQTPTPALTDQETDWLVDLATLTARARSAVERDSYSRDIELVPPHEAPTRIIVMLARLLQGLAAIGLDRNHSYRVVVKSALDSMPTLRLRVLTEMLGTDEQLSTTEISRVALHPNTTTRRALEDLTAHGLVHCHPQGEGKAHEWSLSEFSRTRLEKFVGKDQTGGTFPDLSSSERRRREIENYAPPETDVLPTQTDVSGKVPALVSDVYDPTIQHLLDEPDW